jgi:hypothetical protein
MATTTTYPPVTIERVPPVDPDTEAFRFGFSDAAFVSDIPELNALRDDHPAGLAWDALMDEVLVEIGPDVARMITEAVARRLPWTWEPER